jgi:hypothetical protein
MSTKRIYNEYLGSSDQFMTWPDYLVKNKYNFTLDQFLDEADFWSGYYNRILINLIKELEREQLLKYWTEI